MNGVNIRANYSLMSYGNIAEQSDLDGLIFYPSSNQLSQYVNGSCYTIDGLISST